MSDLIDFGLARRRRAYEELRERAKRDSGTGHLAISFMATMLPACFPASLPSDSGSDPEGEDTVGG